MKNLLSIFPFIQDTQSNLEKQNKLLNKVTLTGKINALEEAANLFEFTDKTIIIFDEIKIELINALLHENLNKVKNELDFKSKTAIDILIRNLFERTADVGFLATDSVISKFLSSDIISINDMKTRLIQYTQKYSVYNEIILLDTYGNVKVNIHPENKPTYSQDSLLKEAINSNEYIEVYKHTDLFKSQDKTLVYAQKVLLESQTIGVLCLCFKFDDELQGIFSQLSHNGEQIAILDKQGIICSNTQDIQAIKFDDSEFKVVEKKYISVSNKTSSYQGYSGINTWYSIAQSSSNSIKNLEISENVESTTLSLLNENLKGIIEKANDLVEDISDVIINGELIAAKRKVYILTPILENLRNISTSLLQTIKLSVSNLEKVIKEALIHDVKMASHLAIDIMDRNLYERANDSRWWALTPLFIEELSSADPNVDKLNKTLRYINELYTVYTNIFLYNSQGTIIAVSNDTNIIGEKISDTYTQKTLNNRQAQNYFVSDFATSPYYNHKPTYIYSASIECIEKSIAGIAVVFDSEPEFKAMLNDSFPKNKKGFSVFTDKDKMIISTNSTSLNVLETLDIDDKYFTNSSENSISDFITLNGVNYVMALVTSQGYREYKTNDNYKNTIYAITFVEI